MAFAFVPLSRLGSVVNFSMVEILWLIGLEVLCNLSDTNIIGNINLISKERTYTSLSNFSVQGLIK